MQVGSIRATLAMRIGLVAMALALLIAPWLFDLASRSLAAWSTWSISACFLAAGVTGGHKTMGFTATALMALGLWALVAPGILGFAQSSPSAFWAHMIAGLFALRGSYVTFQAMDRGEFETILERA